MHTFEATCLIMGGLFFCNKVIDFWLSIYEDEKEGRPS